MLYKVCCKPAHGRHVEKIVVDTAYDAEKEYSSNSDPHAEALAARRTEVGDLTFVLTDKHSLHDKEIVVERDDGVDQSDQHEDIYRYRTLVDG